MIQIIDFTADKQGHVVIIFCYFLLKLLDQGSLGANSSELDETQDIRASSHRLHNKFTLHSLICNGVSS